MKMPRSRRQHKLECSSPGLHRTIFKVTSHDDKNISVSGNDLNERFSRMKLQGPLQMARRTGSQSTGKRSSGRSTNKKNRRNRKQTLIEPNRGTIAGRITGSQKSAKASLPQLGYETFRLFSWSKTRLDSHLSSLGYAEDHFTPHHPTTEALVATLANIHNVSKDEIYELEAHEMRSLCASATKEVWSSAGCLYRATSRPSGQLFGHPEPDSLGDHDYDPDQPVPPGYKLVFAPVTEFSRDYMLVRDEGDKSTNKDWTMGDIESVNTFFGKPEGDSMELAWG